MTYFWLAGWLLVTLQVLMVGVFVIWIALCTRSTLDIKVGPISCGLLPDTQPTRNQAASSPFARIAGS